jgi:hypothetical protein
MIMHNKNRSTTESIFIIAPILFCLVFLLFSSLASSKIVSGEQSGKTEKKRDSIGRLDVEYEASDFRDPFYPPVSISKKKEPEAEEEIKEARPVAKELSFVSIQGIIWNLDNPLAIINNQVFKKEETLPITGREAEAGEITIIDIDKDGVTVNYSGELIKLPSPAVLELQKIKGGINE